MLNYQTSFQGCVQIRSSYVERILSLRKELETLSSLAVSKFQAWELSDTPAA
jgi:hypothetical protein